MKFLEISVGKSLDVNTGSEWVRCDAKVSVEEGEDPETIFKQVRAEINKWLPNPNEYPTIGKNGYFGQQHHY